MGRQQQLSNDILRNFRPLNCAASGATPSANIKYSHFECLQEIECRSRSRRRWSDDYHRQRKLQLLVPRTSASRARRSGFDGLEKVRALLPRSFRKGEVKEAASKDYVQEVM